jgi:hypothetical protein
MAYPPSILPILVTIIKSTTSFKSKFDPLINFQKFINFAPAVAADLLLEK